MKISDQLKETGWVAMLSLEDFERQTEKAKEGLHEDDEWVDCMPEAFPCLASGTMTSDHCGEGVYLAGWQFIELKFAVHLTGFAPICLMCNFGRLAVNAKNGERECTHCG